MKPEQDSAIEGFQLRALPLLGGAGNSQPKDFNMKASSEVREKDDN